MERNKKKFAKAGTVQISFPNILPGIIHPLYTKAFMRNLIRSGFNLMTNRA